jgi:hypothetical protein
MISWLKAAIARLLGNTTQPSDSHAQLTQTAGRANQVPTQPRGNKRSALLTAPLAAQTESKPKRSRARKTTAEASPKQERTTAKRTAIQVGQQQEAPAFPIPQPAKRGRKPKQ